MKRHFTARESHEAWIEAFVALRKGPASWNLRLARIVISGENSWRRDACCEENMLATGHFPGLSHCGGNRYRYSALLLIFSHRQFNSFAHPFGFHRFHVRAGGERKVGRSSPS